MAEIELLRSLFSRLDGDDRLRQRNFQVCMVDGSELAVKWKWHLRGVWSEVEGQLRWTPAGHLQPSHRCSDVKQALNFTLSEVVGIEC